MSSKVHIDNSVAERLSAFLLSSQFTIKSTTAKSEYWKYHGKLLRTKVGDGPVEISGGSGFYVPPRASSYSRRTVSRAIKAIKSPKKIAPWLHGLFTSRFGLPRFMSY